MRYLVSVETISYQEIPEKGKKILDDNMARLKIIFNYLYPNWNYLNRAQTCQDQELLR
jgi:hypothetical protein